MDFINFSFPLFSNISTNRYKPLQPYLCRQCTGPPPCQTTSWPQLALRLRTRRYWLESGVTFAGLLGAQDQSRAVRSGSRNSSQGGTAARKRTARPQAPDPPLWLSRFLQSCIQRPTRQEWPEGSSHASTTDPTGDLCPRRKPERAGPSCAHTLPRRTGPACPVTFSKFTCIPERPSGRSGPGRSEPGRRAGSGPCGPGRTRGHSAGHQGRPESTGTVRATHLALPGLRMQRRLGTDAPRARCMLMAGGRAMNYSAAARRGRARLGGRPGPRVPRRCRAAAPTSQTFPGPHRGCGPRGAVVPARARWPRFSRCRLFYVFCLGVGTCPRERVSLPTPSPPDRGGGGGTGDRGGGDGGSKAPARLAPCVLGRPPGGGGDRARAPGHLCSAGRSGLRTRPEYQGGRRARCGPVHPGAAPP